MKMIRLFIADDHQLVIDGIKAMLADAPGVTITGEANNGKQAIDLLAKIPADILVMDIDMPVLNGYDTAKILSSRYPDLKIIALTSYNEKAVIKKMLEAGASGYILKNVGREELIHALHQVASGQQYTSSEISLALLSEPAANVNSILPPPATGQPVDLLTERELEILKLIAQGFSNSEIGEKLFISPRTVDKHRTNIMEKIGVNNIAGLIRYAFREKIVK